MTFNLLTSPQNKEEGEDRRCVFSDGLIADFSVKELIRLQLKYSVQTQPLPQMIHRSAIATHSPSKLASLLLLLLLFKLLVVV